MIILKKTVFITQIINHGYLTKIQANHTHTIQSKTKIISLIHQMIMMIIHNHNIKNKNKMMMR